LSCGCLQKQGIKEWNVKDVQHNSVGCHNDP